MCFKRFFDEWLTEQDRQLQELKSASRDHNEEQLVYLLQRVMQHHENFYRVKCMSAKEDVLAMFSPTWTSSLEQAFHWIAGWRPTMVFHLVYAESGLRLEAGLSDLLEGLSDGGLGDISLNQLVRIDELQRKTIEEEVEITDTMSQLQDTIAESLMARFVAERKNEKENLGDRETVDAVLHIVSKRLQEILEKADDLRLTTLKGMIVILNPVQALDFLTAAAELHLRVHEWGMMRDVSRENQ